MSFPIETIEVIGDPLNALRVGHDQEGNTRVNSSLVHECDGTNAFRIVTRKDETDGKGNLIVELELSDFLIPLADRVPQTGFYSRYPSNVVGMNIYPDSEHIFADSFGTPLLVLSVVDGVVEARAITWDAQNLKDYHKSFFAGEDVPEGSLLPLVTPVPRGYFDYAQNKGLVINRLIGDELFSQLDMNNPDVDFLCRRLVGAIHGYSLLTGQSFKGISRTMLAIPKKGSDPETLSISMHLKSNIPDAPNTSNPHVFRLGQVLFSGVAQFKSSIKQAMGVGQTISGPDPGTMMR